MSEIIKKNRWKNTYFLINLYVKTYKKTGDQYPFEAEMVQEN